MEAGTAALKKAVNIPLMDSFKHPHYGVFEIQVSPPINFINSRHAYSAMATGLVEVIKNYLSRRNSLPGIRLLLLDNESI
ncbi:MAG: hypothetical protein JRF72_06905 [Deltaproteobacteria bacterium]|jgi:hypothetical protein|nr:hypothetical protein [Deltaproteobacteria bacterium]